jgi:hypothetical protein
MVEPHRNGYPSTVDRRPVAAAEVDDVEAVRSGIQPRMAPGRLLVVDDDPRAGSTDFRGGTDQYRP